MIEKTKLKIPSLVFDVWLAIFLIKIIAFSFLPVIDDEAYYWVWGNKLALSYFDHPGMIGWISSLGLSSTYFRIPFIFFNQMSALILIYTGVKFFGLTTKKLLILLALFSLIPVTGLGASLALPDSLLIFFWTLCLYFSLCIVKDSSDIKSACFLGLSMGLGFCTKYHIVLIPIVLLLFSLFNFFEIFKKKKTLGAIFLFGLIGSLPPLIWNYQNQWISFLFQLNHGFSSDGFDFVRVGEYALGQILLASPFLFFLGLSTKSSSNYIRLLKFYFLVPIGFFFLSSLRASVEANWAAISFVSLVLLGVFKSEKISTYAISYFCACYISIALIFVFSPSYIPEKAKEPFEIRSVAQKTESIEPLYGATYQIASQLWFYRKTSVYKPHGISRFDMFDLWSQPVLPPRFYLIFKTSSGIPSFKDRRPVTGTNIDYGLYSLIEMEQI